MERSDGLITKLGSKSPITEAYRVLRTNLEFMSPDNPIRSLLFTSSGPGEGKSTTVANISISMASKGKKVLLIDCDLRKPVQHKIFGVSNMVGITTLLVEHSQTLEEIIQKTHVENLSIITSGPMPPNPAELLGSSKMVNLIKSFMDVYDLVIFDTPPTVSLSDAAILSANIDGVILVVAAGKADRKMVKYTYDVFRKVNANILGVVLNRVKVERGYEQYYYYYSAGEKHAK